MLFFKLIAAAVMACVAALALPILGERKKHSFQANAITFLILVLSCGGGLYFLAKY